jgi:Mrp family chromosome partitioning ATPase
MTTYSDDGLLRRLSEISHILLVLSGKGGVGKSSVSVQLALSLLAQDPTLRIGLLDVDLTGPSLPRMLGMEGRDVLSSEDGWVPVYLDAKSVAAASAGQGLAKEVDGISGGEKKEEKPANEGKTGVLACMSIGFLLSNSTESVVWRGPKKNAMIKQFLGQVRWGELDYLIVDTPPGAFRFLSRANRGGDARRALRTRTICRDRREHLPSSIAECMRILQGLRRDRQVEV